MLKSADDQSNINKEMKHRKSRIHPISQRVKDVRDESRTKKPLISSERAEILTDFYKNHNNPDDSIPVQRAKSFHYLLSHMSIPIEKGQCIIGIRGTDIKEVPTYPEICCHTLKDLHILDSRKKNPYLVSKEVKEVYKKEIIPFWNDKNIRKTIFEKMNDIWIDAYHVGVFTEFMEQRNPGHTAGDKKIFSTGLLEIKEKIKSKIETLNKSSDPDIDQIEELKAMNIASDAMIYFASRYVEKLKAIYEEESDPTRKKELKGMIEISKWVPAHAPRTFWEALQHYWYIHVGIVTEANPWDSFSPGRLDQHLYPFYKKEMEDGSLTREKAKELLELLWLKFNNQPAPSKVGVTAAESNTYNDFSKINIGGLDAHGNDAVNELSYLLLEVLDEMRLLQPNTAAQISEKTPDTFLDRCLDVIDPGFGEPPLFNADVIFQIMKRQGKTDEDAYESGCSGCVETGAFGKESYIITGYFNLPKILEITLHNGIDPLTGKTVGLKTGDLDSYDSFEAFRDAFFKQVYHFIDVKIKGNDIIERLYADLQPVPFLSLFIDECVERACDYNKGGARYNTQYIQFVGLGSISDSLAAIKYHVFDQKTCSMSQLITMLDNDFSSFEEMQQMFLNKTPKFGNDDDYVDTIAQDMVSSCTMYVESIKNSPVRNASRRAYFFPTTCHVYFGEVCGATPDGRNKGFPLSEGISPVQGSDRRGIVPVLQSIGKLDHIMTGGTLLNQRLTPDLLKDEDVKIKIRHLIRAFFSLQTHHIQFNVVSTKLLREAKKHPMEFQDLMVRVAGYSDYFVNLSEGLQNEIIERTEQSI